MTLRGNCVVCGPVQTESLDEFKRHEVCITIPPAVNAGPCDFCAKPAVKICGGCGAKVLCDDHALSFAGCGFTVGWHCPACRLRTL